MTPHEVADKLTEAQRTWLLAAVPTLDKVEKTPCAEWWDHPEALYVEIDEVDYWLAGRGMESPKGSPCFTNAYEQLSPLALEVRRILQERAND